jgi:hypothetical protein
VSLERFAAALEQAGVWYRPRGDGLYFRCPLPDHEDSSASGSADWKPPAGGRSGAVDFACHGCGKERNGEIIAALGLTWSDLFDDAPARPSASSPRARRAPVVPVRPAVAPGGQRVDKSASPVRVPTTRTTRVFTDAAGVELARLHRYDPTGPHAAEGRKGFSWEHRGGPRGGWVRGKRCDPTAAGACAACRDGRTPAAVPLYRLSEVAAAVAGGHRVWITEGGKNADDLAAALPEEEAATTAPDGARGPWSADYTAVLAGATVTVIADRDRPGYEHAGQVAAELRAAGCVVRVVRTPLEVEHGDVSDHLTAGLALADLEELPPTFGAANERPVAVDDEPATEESAPVSDLDERRIEKATGTKKVKLSQARRLLDLALELYKPIVAETGGSFLVPREGPRVVRPLRGGQRSFSCELATRFYERTGQVVGHYATTDVLRVLQGMAERTDPIALPTRVARHGDALVIDLGDATGRAIVVTREGWQVVDESPVLFTRTVRTGALPTPERGGSLDELWRLVNVRSADRVLAEAELVFRYFPDVSHPLPLLTGEAGTGKTSAGETLAGLVDPSPAPVISLPTDPKDWAVQIGQAYSLVLDNVWNLQQWQSDALCMAVTGGHTQYRQLYTDGGLARFGGQQCITLTSIDLGSQKADLTTRLLPIELEPFDRGARMSEGELKAARGESRARILGVLLDRAVAVLRTLPRVDELGLDLPRLSDFARVCKALDLLDGADRYGAYLRLVSQQAGDIADEDEVAAAVIALVESRAGAGQSAWSGTTAELHTTLGRASMTTRSRYWPETPVAFGKRLSSVVGPLREAGVTVDRSRTAGRRTVTLYRTPPEPLTSEQGPAPDRPAESVDLSSAGSNGRDPGGQRGEQPPCGVCVAPGMFCGIGEVVEEDRPCVLCGVLTPVRSRCGAPRHGDCRPGGDPLPAPTGDPGTPPDRPVRPCPAEPPAPRNAGSERRLEPLRRPEGRSATRTAPRRGAHLYGVLDYEALTVVTDRRPGPSEPLDDAYPRTLAGCVELARRHGLEALWVHDSALAWFGVPVDTDETPAGMNGWAVHGRGDADQVELAVPAWLTGSTTWAEAESGRELAGALAAYEAALGMRFRAAPAATALALLGMLHKRAGARPLIAPTALPSREVCASERDLSWCRPLTEAERSARFVIGLDKHGAYPGVMKSLSLGMGDPEHHPEGRFDSRLPGRHRVVEVAPAPDRSELLPDPMIGVARDGQWRCTETLRYAAEQGVRFTVAESYVWPDSAKPLAMFAERVRTGRADLTARAEDDPAAALALGVLKETYAALGGALASRTIGDRETPGALWRPDWTATVIAKARVNILRNLDKLGARPFAANVDEVFFAVDSEDPADIGLPLGGSFGQYDDKKNPAVPMTAVAAAVSEAVRRGRPSPLLQALRAFRES